MERKRIAIVGVGLIGGSLAIQLHEKKISSRLIGVEANEEHARKAVELELVDEVMPLEQAIAHSDVVVLAIPVDELVKQLPIVMSMIDEQSKNQDRPIAITAFSCCYFKMRFI